MQTLQSMQSMQPMQIIDAQQVAMALNFPTLINALAAGFKQEFGMPQRQVYALSSTANTANSTNSTNSANAANQNTNKDAFAVLPAWNEDVIGVKAFTYFPDNGEKNLPTLFSKIMLFSRESGIPLAMIDGTSVTYWRTAAVSALASRYLARPESSSLLLLGTGNLALPLIAAHCAEHALRTIYLWGRNVEKRYQLTLVAQKAFPHVEFIEVDSLEETVPCADIIVCATGSPDPLIFGKQVSPGCHVDLLGNHNLNQRECDTDLITLSSVYVDYRANVLNEAGELIIPIAENKFSVSAICGDLAELCHHATSSRKDTHEITVFKSVGTALSDLICAHLVYKSQKKSN